MISASKEVHLKISLCRLSLMVTIFSLSSVYSFDPKINGVICTRIDSEWMLQLFMMAPKQELRSSKTDISLLVGVHFIGRTMLRLDKRIKLVLLTENSNILQDLHKLKKLQVYGVLMESNQMV
jgi:hypothetical protein